jgi:hypothetical protein
MQTAYVGGIDIITKLGEKWLVNASCIQLLHNKDRLSSRFKVTALGRVCWTDAVNLRWINFALKFVLDPDLQWEGSFQITGLWTVLVINYPFYNLRNSVFCYILNNSDSMGNCILAGIFGIANKYLLPVFLTTVYSKLQNYLYSHLCFLYVYPVLIYVVK